MSRPRPSPARGGAGRGGRGPDRQAPPDDPRRIAHDVLVRVETSDAFADVLLARRLDETRLSPEDQGLATRLVYGTLAWQGRLDHHLAALASRPLARLDPPVRAALRLGLYQLLFLDRVPAYAAVDASVRLVRRGGSGAAGFVNAILRRAAAAGRSALAAPGSDDGDDTTRLATAWSHPRWIVEQLAAVVGPDELPALLAADNEAGPTALRANTLRTTVGALQAELAAAGVAAGPGRWAPDALVLGGRGAPLRAGAAFAEGRFAFQGEASQLVTRLVAPPSGARVLDACAAPGGKSAYLAALGARVVACDPHRGGARRIAAECARLGAAVRTLVADARRPPCRAAFDAVLVDAPCTGLGTLRRHPELRWRRRAEDVARLAALQRDIVAAVADLVRPGGVLVYAVCTPIREEGPEVVRALLARAPRFVVDPASRWVPEALTTPEGFLQTWPHRHGLDGFFAARLRATA